MKTEGEKTLEELLAAYAQGDAAAFRAFFARSRAIVYGFLRHRLSSAESADDVFQDTYFRVHRYVTSFNPEGNALAWLLRIARGCLNDHLRKRYKTLETLTETTPEGLNQPLAEDAAILKDLLSQASSVLSADDVQIVVERFVEGDSYDEIAERRSWTSANARQRLSRALRKLKADASS